MPSFSDASGTTPNSAGDLEQQLLSSTNCHPQLDRTVGFSTSTRGYQQQSAGNGQVMNPVPPDLHPSTSSGPRSTDSSAPDSPTDPGGSADDMMAIGHGSHGYHDQVSGGYHGGGHHPTMIPASLQLYSQLYHASAAGNMTRHHHHNHHHYHQSGHGDEHNMVSAAQRPTQQAVAAADHSAVWRPY